ncbi:MAG TPA: basic amino acid/polyamine antiporter [Acidimicrobiales bacterium]|nr:basic amino acid/polyamine antiporter [Acidimicrobiales bacterium]
MTETLVHPEKAHADEKVTLPTLTAMVVGSMVGAGVFSLPARFGLATGVYGAVAAWVIAGLGMLMLCYVFQNLALRKPDLDAGVFAYAKAGFGDYVGFNSAFGYWASACVGNCFYWVFIMTTLGTWFPSLGKGDTLLAVALGSAGVWTFHLLIARGVKDAAIINRIVTVAKIIPILVFIVIVAVAFDSSVFRENLWGGQEAGFSTLIDQVKATMIITTFVFLGIEGATVYSRYAKRREDVGRATLAGFLGVLSIFSLVTMVSYGVLPRAELAGARQPSMGSVLESVVGHWGATFINVGVIVSVLGAYLAWTLMSAEVLFIPAKHDDMPQFLRRENKAGTPIAALIMTSLFIQLFLVITLTSDDALNFMLDLCTSLSLIPYLLAAAYALKLTRSGEAYDVATEGSLRRRQFLVSALATFYTLFLVYTAGGKFLLVSCIVYAPGTVLYVMARRENGKLVFKPLELALCVLLAAGAIAGVVGLATGAMTI